MSAKYTPWDKKGAIAQELINNFELFARTNGAAGINSSLTIPKEIRSVCNSHSFLQPLNPSYFPKHFINIATDWKLNKELEKGIRKGK